MDMDHCDRHYIIYIYITAYILNGSVTNGNNSRTLESDWEPLTACTGSRSFGWMLRVQRGSQEARNTVGYW